MTDSLPLTTAMSTDNRPRPLHASRSFTRMDNFPEPELSPRKRASTLQGNGIPAVPAARQTATSPELAGKKPMADVFENNEDDEHAGSHIEAAKPALNVPSTFDELPIEIKVHCERFLERLSAKVHPTPLSADDLSDLFQQFYDRAAGHISTHIAILASRIGRETPPASSASSSSKKQLGRPRAGSGARKGSTTLDDSATGGEMLTASEVSDRKRARKLLEHKKIALEEAVERGVCEKVYEKIWKHRSTDDDARDEKLRSRTAALSLVGIGLKELHMDTTDQAKADVRKTAEEKEEEINQSLSAAREALIRMDDDHYPLGKLEHLKAAHKAIVETLTQHFPSSSSADEILPTLIYTLITSPPEGTNVVSNLNFIQRFRTSSKVDGEAAYCLVNLEAAISFLETVDLSSLREDELPEGPAKAQSQNSGSRPSTPTLDKAPVEVTPRPTVARTLTPGLSPATAISSDQSTPDSSSATSMKAALPSPGIQKRPQLHQRRISGLIQSNIDRIEAGRDNFLNSADKLYESVNGTLDDSMKFLFGRFKEQVGNGSSMMPKTLEDAKKLVSTPPNEQEDSLSISGHSSPGVDDPLNSNSKPADNKVLDLIGGRKQPRDRSVDSSKSGESVRRTVTWDSKSTTKAAEPTTLQGNLFANINPLNQLNKFGMPSFPRFGRAGTVGSSAQPAQSTAAENSAQNAKLSDIVESSATMKDGDSAAALQRTNTKESVAMGDDDMNAREALATLKKIPPPKKRFLEVESAHELKVGEIHALLMDYRRLSKAIGDAVHS
ncbi:Vacuolar protein sorting-associated protein 9b [Fulvia fulva]|uniref:Vacuolar protein sorting-associated protein 9b n=1 Tax=Passalora fulva TaxID=5499 RepID=A0A9Q8PCI2_PASFU|nr:Vacuolar protein sorting-associated protein 9b [Fulvia fulva]UJO19877.1 Vacuolar protein sorting-associated protein 9b [Fulvia fulva]